VKPAGIEFPLIYHASSQRKVNVSLDRVGKEGLITVKALETIKY